jgi:aspartate 1-decarboxylase
MRKFVAAKLHGLHVTDADLDYHGSVTLDPDHCEAAGILPLEFVEIWNKHSGARISTYVIYGERGSRICCLNGAAARTAQVGDELILCSSVYDNGSEITQKSPRIVTFDSNNSIQEILTYVIGKDQQGRLTFAIYSQERELLPVPLRDRSPRKTSKS